MQNFTQFSDAERLGDLISRTIEIAKGKPKNLNLGKGKTIGLLFFNPSLRTRLSTEKAAINLGMQAMVLNVGQDSWQIEWERGAVMNADKQEHIQEAIQVICQYCDILGVRTFPGLKNRAEDYSEKALNTIMQHATVPVVSLESATRHPLQSLADWSLIRSVGIKKPKIAVSWAPHPRALPQAVVNSFLEWAPAHQGADVVLACPKGYEPSAEFLGQVPVTHDQAEALEGADFVYVKNWSSYGNYGKILDDSPQWMLTEEKMALTNNGRFMHCLPLRRNVVATDAVVDSSVVIQQAAYREFAAQAVLERLLLG